MMNRNAKPAGTIAAAGRPASQAPRPNPELETALTMKLPCKNRVFRRALYKNRQADHRTTAINTRGSAANPTPSATTVSAQ